MVIGKTGVSGQFAIKVVITVQEQDTDNVCNQNMVDLIVLAKIYSRLFVIHIIAQVLFKNSFLVYLDFCS